MVSKKCKLSKTLMLGLEQKKLTLDVQELYVKVPVDGK